MMPLNFLSRRMRPVALKTLSFHKTAFICTLFMCSTLLSFGQLVAKVKCPDVDVDILNGTVNGLKPNRTLEEFKTTLPCFTSVQDESTKCGSSIFYKNKDMYIYLKRQYVEIGPKFQGKISLPLLGARRGSLFKYFGNPKLKDDNWDAYDTQYGTLVLRYDATGKVKLIQFSSLDSNNLNLCE